MSLRELQNAAAHVLHLERVADVDPEALGSRFGYHPLDIESILQSPVESTFSSYNGYGYLTLLWPDVIVRETVALRFFFQPRQLTVIGDTSDHAIRNFFDALESATDTQSLTPMELVPEIIKRLVPSLENAVGDAGAVQRLSSATLALRQCGRWLQDNNQTTYVPAFVVLAHRIDVSSDRWRQTEPLPTSPTTQLPRFVGAYAAVAAVMIVAVIVTLSFK